MIDAGDDFDVPSFAIPFAFGGDAFDAGMIIFDLLGTMRFALLAKSRHRIDHF
jgi:hypothetical protein